VYFRCLFGKPEKPNNRRNGKKGGKQKKRESCVFEDASWAVCELVWFALGSIRMHAVCGSSLLLWQHRYFRVVEKDPHRGPPKPYLYLALEFRVIGSLMPPEEVKGLSKKQLAGVWVCGVAYAPCLHVRKLIKMKSEKDICFTPISTMTMWITYFLGNVQRLVDFFTFHILIDLQLFSTEYVITLVLSMVIELL
jgi:hypothetical protein